MYAELTEYKPPAWIERAVETGVLKREAIPTHRYHLMTEVESGRSPAVTPIHRWQNFFPEKHGYEICVKRDDMTGCGLTGNKVRKLEFLLADAKLRQSDVVVTLGALQSNHCRTTAIASKMLGFDVELFMMPIYDPRQVRLDNEALSHKSGNLFLDRAVGAKLHLLKSPELKHAIRQLDDEVEKLRENGKEPYVIPAGGSNEIGLWGYVECVREMLEYQHLENRFDDIVVATGSGGTIAGLALGLFLSGCKKIRLHAFIVTGTSEQFYKHMDEMFQKVSQKRAHTIRPSKFPEHGTWSTSLIDIRVEGMVW